MLMKNGLDEQTVKDIIWRDGRHRENVLGMLIDLQFESPGGYIDEDTAQIVAKELEMTVARVYELISYYAILKPNQQARYVLKICDSSPCHFTKASWVASTLERILDTKMGDISEDGQFAYHYIPCVGACDIGPVIKIKDTVFGNLTEEKIEQLIEDLRNNQYTNL